MLLRETAKSRARALKRDMKGARWQQSVPGLKAFAGDLRASMVTLKLPCCMKLLNVSTRLVLICLVKRFQRLVSVLNRGRSKDGHDGRTIDWSTTQTVIVWRGKYGRTKVRSKRYKV